MNNPPKVIAITGAAGYIGQQLLARLHSEPSVERIVALDRCDLGEVPSKVVFFQQSVTDPLEELFTQQGVQSVVHLAFVLRQGRDRETVHHINVGGTENVLRACRAAGVSRLLYLSSTTVYGPHPDNPIPLTEESYLRPPYAFQYAWDKAQVEKLLNVYAQDLPDTTVTILRGCVVMGPSAHNFITQAFFKPILVGVLGYDPHLQFIHETDLVELLIQFIHDGRSGVYNVAGPGEIRYSQMVRLAHRPLIWLPSWAIYPLTELAWRLRLQSDSPAVGLDFIRYPWIASTEKVQRETGYTFRYSAEEALTTYLRPGADDSDH